MIYYAKNRLRASGCAIVTASHNAADWNGLKWLVGDSPPGPEEVERLRSQSDGAAAEPAEHPTSSRPRPGHLLRLRRLASGAMGGRPAAAPARRLGSDARLLVGAGEAVSQRDLSRVSPFGDSRLEHPDFEGRCPDCSQPDQLHDLCEAVYRGRADLGLAFDGDGDRLAVVDNEGVALTGEETAWILLQAMGPKLKGERFVYDVKFSDRIREAAAELGAEPLVERSGHAFLAARMGRADALFGAELTGHYFFRELAHGDDSLLAACMLIAYLAESGETLADLRRACPVVFMTPDLHVSVNGSDRDALIEGVRRAWSEHPQTTVDGVRIEVPGGWALVRKSVTGPTLSFRFESADWHGLEHLVSRFCQLLPEIGPELWMRYKTAVGIHEGD